MSQAILTINSRNYGAWSLRGWLLCRMARLDFVERVLSSTDPSFRAELLLLSPSFLVPRLEHDGVAVWDTLAIGEYLCELLPDAGLLPRIRWPGPGVDPSAARCTRVSPSCAPRSR